jgi:LuxR family maltose regulon positive regulatory protein
MAARAARYPVTLVEAPAGYGKTTFATMVAAGRPASWYSLTKADRDVQVFLVHLLAALTALCPEVDPARRLLERPGGASAAWPDAVDTAVDALDRHLRSRVTVVLDDFHLVDSPDVGAVLSRVIESAPGWLGIILTARERPDLEAMMRWRGQGRVLLVNRADLAFTSDELGAFLSSRFGLGLTAAQCDFLTEETEGWPIAMELIGQRLVDTRESMESLVSQLPEGREAIFEYLTAEVLADQGPEVRRFLEQIACLRDFDLDDCAYMMDGRDCEELLERVTRSGLFCSSDGRGRHRFHHLLREAMLRQSSASRRTANHRLAARLHRDRGRLEDAIQHALEAEEYEEAAADLERLAPALMFSGRYITFLDWLAALPVVIREKNPRLSLFSSRSHRLISRFERSLLEAATAARLFDFEADVTGWFDAKAEAIAAYLDTVQPARARPLLVAVGRRLTQIDPERRRRWFQMVAENRLNEGRLARSQRLHQTLVQSVDGERLDPRLLVRRGELMEARLAFASEGRVDEHTPRSHREREAMLAWIDGLLGDSDSARRHARAGIERGRELGSPIITCVSTSRLGHAHLTGDKPEPERALAIYEQALALAEEISVPRFRAESLIGSVVAWGMLQDIRRARACGEEALEILHGAGDTYLAAVTLLALGAAATRTSDPDAESWLDAARGWSSRNGELYIRMLAHAWLGHLRVRQGLEPAGRQAIAAALGIAKDHDLERALLASPWLGLSPSERRGVVEGRTPSAGSPAPTLEIRTFGRFEVRSDGRRLGEQGWGRRKARELLWLLCSRDDHSLSRDEVIDVLWPDCDRQTGSIRLRVALHALQAVLEPGRIPRSATRFLHSSAERIWLDESVEVDADQFLAAVHLLKRTAGPEAKLERGLAALKLFTGPFLAEGRHLDWVEARYLRLRGEATGIALGTGSFLLERGRWMEAADLCRLVIAEDPYHEGGYRLLIQALMAGGDISGARRAYEECRHRLQEDLGLEPAAELIALLPVT